MKTQAQSIRRENPFQKIAISAMLVFSIVVTAKTMAYSQGNNYFGTNANGSSSGAGSGGVDYSQDQQPEDSNPNPQLPGLNSTTQGNPPPTGTDFTGDEKRMQKKYKTNVANANSLIAKGTQMMKSNENNKNSAIYKRGKILKEIGEKSLAELKANNPFPQKSPK